MSYTLYVVVALLGIAFRYNAGLVEACRVAGVSISDFDSGTGYQDAITPPSSSNISLITGFSAALLIGFAFYQYGWPTGLISVVVFFIASLIAGATMIPDPESAHYLRRIYHSLINRYADFVKSGDSVRANAIKVLIGKFESKYSHVINAGSRGAR